MTKITKPYYIRAVLWSGQSHMEFKSEHSSLRICIVTRHVQVEHPFFSVCFKSCLDSCSKDHLLTRGRRIFG